MPVLEIRSLCKRYGDVRAVDGLNLSVESGSVYGFLGLNGAGKTTTLRMVTGLARPDGGEIHVCGEKVRFGSPAANRFVGYLPDVPEFYSFMRPREYLTLCGRLSGMNGAAVAEKSAELLGLVGLSGVNRKIGGFSRGMKQRLGIAQALIHSPKMLILDEPTSALDPAGRREILEIIGRLRGKLTVLFSTHILSDVERVCDTIGILRDGRLALEGNLEKIRRNYGGQRVLLQPSDAGRLPELEQMLKKLPYIREIRREENRLVLFCSDIGVLDRAICPLMAGAGMPIFHFEHLEPRLEDVFMEVTKSE